MTNPKDDEQSLAELKERLSTDQTIALETNPETEPPTLSPLADAARTRLTEPGALIANRYKVIKELGAGGMGVVAQARDVVLSKDVAVKLLLARGEQMRTNLRFQQEARTIAILDHPNVIKVQDLNITDEGIPYIVMELVHGRALSDILKQEALTLQRMAAVMIQACDALSHAHSRGVVHRDIKPSNFILCDIEGKEQLKLVDFGIAKLQAPDTESLALTQTGEVFGSPLYMSPEQCEARDVDARCDIYSLGCVMYEALTGSPPFMGPTSFSVILKHVNESAIPLTESRPELPGVESVNAIIMRCLEKSPQHRYESAAQLRLDLETLLAGGEVQYVSQPKKDITQISIAHGGERFRVMDLNQPFRLYGFTQRQLAVLAIAAVIGFLGAARMHNQAGLIFLFALVVPIACIFRGLEQRSSLWWRNRLGFPAKITTALPDLRLLPSVDPDQPAANLPGAPPVCWKIDASALGAINVSKRRQLASMMINILPDYPGMELFHSTLDRVPGGRSQRNFYLVLPGALMKDKSAREVVAQIESIGVPLQPMSEQEVSALMQSQLSGQPQAPDTQKQDNSGVSGVVPGVTAAIASGATAGESDRAGTMLVPLQSQIEPLTDRLVLNGKHAVAVVFTRLPHETYFGWWQMILDLPFEMSVATHFLPCDSKKVRDAMHAAALTEVLRVGGPAGAKVEVPTGMSTVDLSIYLTIYADTTEQLAKNLELLRRTVGNMGGQIDMAEFRQMECFVSALPLAEDRMKTIHRIVSNAAATFIPLA